MDFKILLVEKYQIKEAKNFLLQEFKSLVVWLLVLVNLFLMRKLVDLRLIIEEKFKEGWKVREVEENEFHHFLSRFHFLFREVSRILILHRILHLKMNIRLMNLIVLILLDLN